MSELRANRVRALTRVGLGGFVVLSLLVILLFRFGGSALTGRGQIVAGTVAVTVLVLWWVVFAVRIYRAQDEFGQTGESVAWHWGGLIGLMASVPVFTFIGTGGLHWLDPSSAVGPEVARAFRLGYMVPLVMQIVGAMGVGLWWRWAKR